MARWDKIRHRGNVQDRRGMRPAKVAGGIGGIGILLVIAVGIMGGEQEAYQVYDVLSQINQNSTQYTEEGTQSSEFAGEDSYEVFASTVLGSNNYYWDRLFKSGDAQYVEPTLVLFRGSTESACGGATSAIGPHYCPTDETIYLDETFFDELQRRFGAKGGDVAEAYVIAHEVGHHVQTRLGTSTQVRKLQQKNPSKANDLSVSLELQADCYAGLWANSIRDQGVFGRNEISEAIDAAEAVGDDRIQESVNGRINPESWTHGSSADRKKWFNIGYETGDVKQCDTF